MTDGETDCRRVMSDVEFDRIPIHDGYLIVDYCEALIEQNEHITQQHFTAPQWMNELTEGQRMLIQLSAFDGQVRNGGIAQFFWNHFEWIVDVRTWIETLGVSPLQETYGRTLEHTFNNGERLTSQRLDCFGDKTAWDDFAQRFESLDLAWFDDAYFGEYGYNRSDEWVCLVPGLQKVVEDHVVDYICKNRSEFIVRALPTSTPN